MKAQVITINIGREGKNWSVDYEQYKGLLFPELSNLAILFNNQRPPAVTFQTMICQYLSKEDCQGIRIDGGKEISDKFTKELEEVVNCLHQISELIIE